MKTPASMVPKKVAITIVAVVILAATIPAMMLLHFFKSKPTVLTGAVIRQDVDPQKELPISGVVINVLGSRAVSVSDSSGFFRLSFGNKVTAGRIVTLSFRHPGYLPLDFNVVTGDNLYVARMVPVTQEAREDNSRATVVSNVRVRYSVSSETTMDIGSAVKTFQVITTGNVPCKSQSPCSPDGKWKAAVGSASLDAGRGNEFRNARASCIAGPCPFTRINSSRSTDGGRNITASALGWSDTTTFLVEAEVFHQMVSDSVRESYPVIFGRALNFTLPAAAEGVSIEAEIDGDAIVFPLGPNLFLSWAECEARVNNDQTKVYRCELKPRHRF